MHLIPVLVRLPYQCCSQIFYSAAYCHHLHCLLHRQYGPHLAALDLFGRAVLLYSWTITLAHPGSKGRSPRHVRLPRGNLSRIVKPLREFLYNIKWVINRRTTSIYFTLLQRNIFFSSERLQKWELILVDLRKIHQQGLLCICGVRLFLQEFMLLGT